MIAAATRRFRRSAAEGTFHSAATVGAAATTRITPGVHESLDPPKIGTGAALWSSAPNPTESATTSTQRGCRVSV
jgi:hypothetical protein